MSGNEDACVHSGLGSREGGRRECWLGQGGGIAQQVALIAV